jgi:nucleotide-binding universal stress UspA family protein
VYVLHFARAHILPGDIIAGSHFGVLSAKDDVEAADREEVQRLGDGLAAAGNDAHGEMLSATEHDIAEVILQRARDRNVGLIMRGHQHHHGAGNLFQSCVAERVIRQHPRVLNPVGAAPRAAGGLGSLASLVEQATKRKE